MIENKKMNNFKKELNGYLEYLNPVLNFLAIQDTLQKSDIIFVCGGGKARTDKNYLLPTRGTKINPLNF